MLWGQELLKESCQWWCGLRENTMGLEVGEHGWLGLGLGGGKCEISMDQQMGLRGYVRLREVDMGLQIV